MTVQLRNMTATSGIWEDNTVKKDGHRWFGDARLFLAELFSILMLQTHGESCGGDRKETYVLTILHKISRMLLAKRTK